MKLTHEQLAFWQDNGYLAVDGVIAPAQVAQERARFDYWCGQWRNPHAKELNIQHEPGLPADKLGPATVRKIHKLEQHDPVFRAHACDQGLLDLVAQLIGTPVWLYETQAFLKAPEVGSPKPPHQDNAYFLVEPSNAVITCWGAVDDATLENGCMQYYPGSHKLGLIEHRWLEGTPHQVPVGCEHLTPRPAPIAAGGVIFHHSLTMHMSLQNQSRNWRRAFACHYIREDADASKSPVPRQDFVKVRD